MTSARISIFILLILFFAAYLLYQTKTFFAGPEIIVFEPVSGAVLHNSIVEIKGRAENISFLSLNKSRIYTREDGSFSEDLILAPGFNIIEVAASDKFGRETVKKISVMLKDE